MKSVLLSLFLVGCAPAFAQLGVTNASGTKLGQVHKMACGSGLTCTATGGQLTIVGGAFTGDVTGDGGDQLYGFLQNQVASSATTLTVAQCGSTIVTAGAHEVNLPEASTALGCRYTFVGGTADTLTIDPADGTDQIGPINFVAAGTGGAIAPSAGDSVTISDIGASLELEACGANLWCPVGVANLTVTDAN